VKNKRYVRGEKYEGGVVTWAARAGKIEGAKVN